MRAVIGALFACGDWGGDRKVEKPVVGSGDLIDRGEIAVETSGQAEGGDRPSRYRRNVGDGAGRRELLAQFGIDRGALGVDIEGRRRRLDRQGRIEAVPLASDLQLGAEILVVEAVVRRVLAQGTD